MTGLSDEERAAVRAEVARQMTDRPPAHDPGRVRRIAELLRGMALRQVHRAGEAERKEAS